MPNLGTRAAAPSFHRHLTEQQWREQAAAPSGNFIGLWCDDDNAYHLCWDRQSPVLYSTPLIDRRYFGLSHATRAASLAERMALELWGAMPLDALSDEPLLDHEKWLSVWPLSRRALPSAASSALLTRDPLFTATSRPGLLRKSHSGLRVGRSHRGLHKRLLEKSITEALQMVGRLASGETVSAPLVMAQALEACHGIGISPRDRDGRLILAEVERLRVHFESIIAVARLTGQELLETHAALILRKCEQACAEHAGGHHMMGCIMLGGMSPAIDATALAKAIISTLPARLPLLVKLISHAETVLTRRATVPRHRAEAHLLRGVNGRASGYKGDLRLMRRDPRFTIKLDALSLKGDAYARLWNRYHEITESLAYLTAIHDHDTHEIDIARPVVYEAHEATSFIEGARGESWCWVKCQDERLTHFHLQTGSFNTLPVLLELCLAGEDEQFLEASFAYSPAGAEL